MHYSIHPLYIVTKLTLKFIKLLKYPQKRFKPNVQIQLNPLKVNHKLNKL
jgi:hypothetical protein